MKTMRLITSLAALCAITNTGMSLAATDYVVPAEGFVSSRTRAEVRAELRAARADGSTSVMRMDGDENRVLAASAAAGAGSTRRQVGEALASLRGSHPGRTPDTLYFGD